MTPKSSQAVDLHIHTHYSDSSYSPRQVVETAIAKGLAAIAITDHDCVDGIAPALAESAAQLEIVPGVELSAEVQNSELHIVGLLIEWQNVELNHTLAKIRAARTQRMARMISKLNERGIDISIEEVIRLNNSQSSLGRLHLARALMIKRKVRSIQEAFGRFLGRHAACYVRRMIITPSEAIDLIMRSEGVPVLAHPALSKRDDLIPALIKSGLRAIEVKHTDHSPSQEKHYRKLAAHYKLQISGGSDCHGMGKGTPLLGSVKMPYAVLETLRQEKKKLYGKIE